MSDEYSDGRIELSPEALLIHGYYLPWGTKRIPYAAIRAVRRVNMGALTGRARIWGTANPRYWANLDPGRPRKTVGFILDTGRAVRPFLTPDSPEDFQAALAAHCDAPVERAGRGAIV